MVAELGGTPFLVEFPLFEKKNLPNSISASPILLLLQTMKVVKYKFERNIQDVDYFGKDSSKNTPNQGARYEVLCIELTFLFSSHTREHYGSGPHCFFSHFWSQNFHWNHTNCIRNMTWCHIAHKLMDTIWIVFSHRKNIMGSSPVHRVTIEGMIRSIVPDKSAWLPRTKLQLERLLVGEGRDGSWWRRWGPLTMVSRAGRAFPTVHTDLLQRASCPII